MRLIGLIDRILVVEKKLEIKRACDKIMKILQKYIFSIIAHQTPL